MFFSRLLDIVMTLSGGWDGGFTINTGVTSVIAGPLALVGPGTLIIENITVE